MLDSIEIRSLKNTYKVEFNDNFGNVIHQLALSDSVFVIDKKLLSLYSSELEPIINCARYVAIEANEDNKCFDKLSVFFNELITLGFKRDQKLVALGGGIIQDIACFASSILFRGVEWQFVPTTLLAQADSCIGSKSSINLGRTKNLLGSFHPPTRIWICTDVRKSLSLIEIKSGIGEILKAFAIDSDESWAYLEQDFNYLLSDDQLLQKYIKKALLIKKKFIEVDEFDKDIRNIFNYGHSFGHAIEAATCFSVPHGIAVTIGMDIANDIAVKLGLLPKQIFVERHKVLASNYVGYQGVDIDFQAFWSALLKDKKNTASALKLILPKGDGAEICQILIEPEDKFKQDLEDSFRAIFNE